MPPSDTKVNIINSGRREIWGKDVTFLGVVRLGTCLKAPRWKSRCRSTPPPPQALLMLIRAEAHQRHGLASGAIRRAEFGLRAIRPSLRQFLLALISRNGRGRKTMTSDPHCHVHHRTT